MGFHVIDLNKKNFSDFRADLYRKWPLTCSALNSSSPLPPTRAAFLSITKVAAVVVEVTAVTSTYVKKIDDEEYRGIEFFLHRTDDFFLSFSLDYSVVDP